MKRGVWRTPSASASTGNCVEVQETDKGVLVRNSRNPGGTVIAYTFAEWGAFLQGVRAGEFDLSVTV